MSKELIVSTTSHETRVAVIEEDQVTEVFFQRENEYSLAGSIHKGRVTRVLPGMQSAFVDIGLERDAFLYVSDFFEDNEEYEKVVSSAEDQVLKMTRGGGAPPAPAAAPVEGLAEPAAAGSAPAEAQQPSGRSDERTERGDRGDRDRRGRRSRRRRPGRGGRGLPESKFYNPAAREAEPHIEAEPAAAVETSEHALAPESDEEVLILPGESLAKYRGGEEPAVAEADVSEEAAEEAADAEAEPETEPAAMATGEMHPAAVAAAVGPPPPALPPPPQTHQEPPIEAVAETAVGPIAEIPECEPAPIEHAPAPAAVQALDDAPPDQGSGDPVVDLNATVDAAAGVEAESVESAEPAAAFEPVEAAAAAESGQAAAAGEPVPPVDEGPEPARIPTSLTATLREQGPRYMHRISRRMRRKGGRGPMEDRPPREQRPEGQPSEQPQPQQQRTASRPERAEKSGTPSISDLLREGQEIIVQIAKEPLGQKGARITSHIALPGRFLVYMPTVDHIGVSRKVGSDEERARLKRILQTHRTGIPGGYIVRTAGEGRTEEELKADMLFLYNLWLDLRQKAEKRPAPALVHHDLDVVQRVLRDQLTHQFKSVWVDNEDVYASVVSFVQRFQPGLVNRVKLYTRPNPIFDEFNVTAELEKALRPKVWLKSGGYIVINQTEALVAIDVNTGKFVGKSNRLEDTIVKTNTDAIKEIVRQIRLRDLGGIIVVDFIDMDERKNRQKVMQALEEAMRADRAPYKILQFNDFGLVAITRKRVKQSLERTLCSPCPYCEAAGYVKSVGTVIGEILQEAHKIAKAVEGNDVMLRVNPEVAKVLKSNQNSFLQELEEILGRTVIVKSDALLHQEKFDLA
jgi:ribonuclease G